MPEKIIIPVCRPTLLGNEKKYVNECLDTNWISSNGRFIKEFETKFAEFCGTKYGVSCNSGTSALHLALLALNIGKGDEVIVPTFTMIATTNAIYYTGAKPVYVDSELETWNIDTTKIEEKITSNTKAIMVVHTYGCPVNMGKVIEIGNKYGLPIIEDAAEAHGAEYKGKIVGGIGDIGCFSFYGNKILTGGESGMVVTNNYAIAERCRSLKNHAFRVPRFIHSEIGYNYRMTNIAAAICLAQLERAKELIGGRVGNAWWYNKYLYGLKGITTPPECTYGRNVYWMYGILVDKSVCGIDKDTLMKKLEENGVETRSFFYPAHLQPAYPTSYEKFPIAEQLWEQGLYLPSSSDLNSEEIKQVCTSIREVVSK